MVKIVQHALQKFYHCGAAPHASDPDGAEWARDTLFWQSGYYRVVRHQDWKLQITERPKREWLFNLAEDPTEQNNLAESEPEKVNELRSLLAQHAARAREPLHPSVAEMPVAVDKTRAESVVPGDEFVYWPN